MGHRVFARFDVQVLNNVLIVKSFYFFLREGIKLSQLGSDLLRKVSQVYSLTLTEGMLKKTDLIEFYTRKYAN